MKKSIACKIIYGMLSRRNALGTHFFVFVDKGFDRTAEELFEQKSMLPTQPSHICSFKTLLNLYAQTFQNKLNKTDAIVQYINNGKK
jgi:hypothetical protein